ncbi:MAG: peptide-methionine (S)-S-oxide reductase [Kiritimatiellia bacterium]
MFLRPVRAARLPSESQALPGRSEIITVAPKHAVLGSSMVGPWPEGSAVLQFAMGCFWGAERVFWQLDGVVSTQVGYAGGHTPNPTYGEVCSGGTAHTEVVRVVYDPSMISLAALLSVFFEGHDPTQGMRQGNDAGTQYRSAVYVDGDEELVMVERVKQAYQARLTDAGRGEITTEVKAGERFFFAEDYHQQYLAKNPGGYCGIGGTGVSCPVGLSVEEG